MILVPLKFRSLGIKWFSCQTSRGSTDQALLHDGRLTDDNEGYNLFIPQ